MNTFNNNSGSQRKEEESWHIKKLVLKFLNQLHWFILSVLAALIIAFLINHFSTPIYRISSKILIEDSENKQSTGALAGPERDLTQGFGLYAGMQNFDNQSIILKSYTQLYSTLKELKFEISYFKKKPLNTTEIYKESPFRVVYDSTHVQPIGVKFELQVLKNGKLKLTARDKKTTLYNFMSNEPVRSKVPVFVSREISPGEVVKAPEYSFSIILNNQIPPETDCKYYFTFTSLDQLVLNYQEELTVTPIQKRASLLELSLQSADPPKGKDFLNKLMEVYLKNNLNKKNEIASRTINFIEKQLSEVSDSLRIAENRKERFQTDRQVMNLSFQGEEIYRSVNEIEKSKAALEAQQKYFIYLKNYLETHAELESIVAPSAMGIDDQLLNKLILELNRLSLEKSTLSATLKLKDHPMMKKLDAQIRNTKATLIENAKGLLNNSQISMDGINKRLANYEQQAHNLPKTQQQYVNIERKYTLNNEIYNFLLQRRAEAQIARVSNTPDNEIVDRATFIADSPVFPKKNLNYILALILGIIVPGSVLGLKNFFNNKIHYRDDIKRITDKPIIGHVFHLDENTPEMLLLNTPNAPSIEPFWAIRTQLDFFTGDKRCPVIVITSSSPGEGKTFCSINIATAYALSGKKTLLIGFDLRKPKIHRAFKFRNTVGLSSCLIGAVTPEEAIHKTMNENLDVLPSGPIPPNPSQLVVNTRTRELMDHLKKTYECIILDTAPMGLVSEAYFLARLADATILVVRQSYSLKEQLSTCLNEAENNNIQNVSILMNDVSLKSTRYDYNYNYGYDYAYSGESKN